MNDEFLHDWDDDNNGIVDVGNWSAYKSGGRRSVQENNGDEDYDGNNDGDENHENDNESDDSIYNNKDGGNEGSEDERTEEDGGDLNGVQQMIEDEAVAAGMTGGGRNKRVRDKQAMATRTSPRKARQQSGRSGSNKRQKFGQVINDVPPKKDGRKRGASAKYGEWI